MCKTSVRDSQIIQSLSIIKANHFKLFMEISDFYFETHTRHINTLRKKNAELY
jgi:hypothetical protein